MTAARQSTALGVTCIVLAFGCVAAMSAFGKAASSTPSAMIVFFQSGVSLVLLLPWRLRYRETTLRTGRLGLHIVRALGGLLSQVLMFVAVKRMPLASAVLLSNSAPLFIPLVAWLWLKERIPSGVWISVLLGFAGVVLILRPGRALLSNPVAVLAVAAAICSAVALVAVHELSTSEPPWRVLLYYFVFSSVAAAPFALWQWHAPTAREWLLLVAIGVAMAASQLLIVLAYRYATPERIAPFNYTVVLFSAAIEWLVWHDAPSMLAIVGALLVVAGGVASMMLGGASAKQHQGSVGTDKRFHHDGAK